MATAKQLAWRKEFATRVKAGTLKTNPTKRKATKRRGPSKVNAPSQAKPHLKPTPRLKARRRANTKPGMYPNPVRSAGGFPIKVQVWSSAKWKTIATFAEPSRAGEYAKAINATEKYSAVRVWKD